MMPRQSGSNIVEGEHKLWSQVSDPYKHTIRAFLVNFHTHVLLQSTEHFTYRNGSIGEALGSMSKPCTIELIPCSPITALSAASDCQLANTVLHNLSRSRTSDMVLDYAQTVSCDFFTNSVLGKISLT